MTIKDTFLKYWFSISAVGLAVLYLLYDRRGRTIDQLKDDARRQILAQQLVAIREQSERSEKDAEDAKLSYEGLKRRHADLLKQYGISTGDTSSDTH